MDDGFWVLFIPVAFMGIVGGLLGGLAFWVACWTGLIVLCQKDKE